jgi:PTS system nitrogen regulatory IIA component
MSKLPQPVQALLAARARAERGISWAPLGGGFALPHFSTHVTVGRDSGLVALILLRDGLVLPEAPVDQVPVTRLLFFVPPSPRAHLDVLGRLARVIAKGHLRELLEAGAADEEILRAIAAADVAPAPGTEREPS